MTLPLTLLLFAGMLAVLLSGARIFTAAAERVGLALGLSPFVVGVLIVATGTSLPELVAALIAAAEGTSEIVAGNVLGANASNLFLVFGAVAVAAREVDLGEQYLFVDLHFLVGSAFLLALAMKDGTVTPVEGAFLLAAFAVYVRYLVQASPPPAPDAAATTADVRVGARDVGGLVGGGAMIWFGADGVIEALGTIATSLGIAPAIVALTLLSLGTTLPELVVSLGLARRGRADVAAGNVLGSCVFNALAVSGAASLVTPVAVPDALRTLALPVYGGGALLFYLLAQDKRVSRWEGALLLVIQGLFLAKVAGIA